MFLKEWTMIKGRKIKAIVTQSNQSAAAKSTIPALGKLPLLKPKKIRRQMVIIKRTMESRANSCLTEPNALRNNAMYGCKSRK